MTDAVARILNIWRHLWHLENKCQFRCFISRCRWWRRHQIRQEIVSNVRDISHITSQILHIYTNLPNPTRTQTKQFWFGSGSSRSPVRFGSVRVLHIFFCMSVLVRFGSAKMWVLIRFVRFEFGSIPISSFDVVDWSWEHKMVGAVDLVAKCRTRRSEEEGSVESHPVHCKQSWASCITYCVLRPTRPPTLNGTGNE